MGRILWKLRAGIAHFARPALTFILILFVASSGYALFLGADQTRALIRIIFYLGVFSILFFCYEMGRRPDCYDILLKGVAITGIIFALYGLYQLIAVNIGLPVRLIVRGTEQISFADEGGILRVNSFASEPKRLGYILFLGFIACLFLANQKPAQASKWKWSAYGTLAISILTFSGSYFLAIVLFGMAALILYPFRSRKFVFLMVPIFVGIILLIPDLGVSEAIQDGYERRSAEIEVGLDGIRVYRQEFFAWDYLARYPKSIFSGVGMGQYYSIFFQEYGEGAGFNDFGGLIPLNSTLLETLFDLSGIGAALIYLSTIALILKLRQAGETFLCLSLLFVTIQSFTILTLPFMALFAGIGIARLALPSSINHRSKSVLAVA
jgi:hypothetical protein